MQRVLPYTILCAGKICPGFLGVSNVRFSSPLRMPGTASAGCITSTSNRNPHLHHEGLSCFGRSGEQHTQAKGRCNCAPASAESCCSPSDQRRQTVVSIGVQTAPADNGSYASPSFDLRRHTAGAGSTAWLAGANHCGGRKPVSCQLGLCMGSCHGAVAASASMWQLPHAESAVRRSSWGCCVRRTPAHQTFGAGRCSVPASKHITPHSQLLLQRGTGCAHRVNTHGREVNLRLQQLQQGSSFQDLFNVAAYKHQLLLHSSLPCHAWEVWIVWRKRLHAEQAPTACCRGVQSCQTCHANHRIHCGTEPAI